MSGTNKIFAQWDFVNFGCTWKNSNWTSPQGFRNVPVADSTVYRENVAEYGFGQVRWNLRFFFFFFWQLLKSFKRKSFKSRIYLFLNPLKERGSSVTHFHQGHWNQRLPWPHNFTGHPHPLSDLILSFKVNLICIGMECKWSASNKVLLAFLTLALKSKSNTGCQKDRMPLKCWEFGTLHVSHKNVSLPSLANRNL